MADSKAWNSALSPQKAPTYGKQAMFITCPRELEMLNTDYIVVFEGTKKYHVTTAKIVNPFTLHVIIPEHDIAEEVNVEVYLCQNDSSTLLTMLKFTYISQMEHAIAKFLAQSASDPDVADKLDAVWTVCLGKDHVDLWDKKLAQAFSQLELPLEWTLVGDVLQTGCEFHQTLLHFAANHGLKELLKVFLQRPGAKLALSKCDKSGLLPRDVAREKGRLDIVELLDSESFEEKRKSVNLKDTGWCQVIQDNTNGVASISNDRNHSKQEDVQFLHELNKLALVKNGSPVCRHSWPVKAKSFHADTYLENLENKISETIPAGGGKNSVKRPFLDENLINLRDVTEELCQLRSQNSQKTSNEIAIIADRNRNPMHSRRYSCPASVSQRRKISLSELSRRGTPYPQSPKLHPEKDEESKCTSYQQTFSSPPHSPVVGQLIDISSTVAITPPLDEPVPNPETTPDQYLTPTVATSDKPSQEPTSPMPISYRFTNVEKRTSGRKERPSTWYGGPNGNGFEEETFRRSNSLEDFANKLTTTDDSDNESETHSKDDLLQTISSIVNHVDRKESFLSSLSDLSVSKDSIGSENEQEVDSDEEKDFDGKQEKVGHKGHGEEQGDDEHKEEYEEHVKDKEKYEHEDYREHVERNKEYEEKKGTLEENHHQKQQESMKYKDKCEHVEEQEDGEHKEEHEHDDHVEEQGEHLEEHEHVEHEKEQEHEGHTEEQKREEECEHGEHDEEQGENVEHGEHEEECEHVEHEEEQEHEEHVEEQEQGEHVEEEHVEHEEEQDQGRDEKECKYVEELEHGERVDKQEQGEPVKESEDVEAAEEQEHQEHVEKEKHEEEHEHSDYVEEKEQVEHEEEYEHVEHVEQPEQGEHVVKYEHVEHDEQQEQGGHEEEVEHEEKCEHGEHEEEHEDREHVEEKAQEHVEEGGHREDEEEEEGMEHEVGREHIEDEKREDGDEYKHGEHLEEEEHVEHEEEHEHMDDEGRRVDHEEQGEHGEPLEECIHMGHEEESIPQELEGEREEEGHDEEKEDWEHEEEADDEHREHGDEREDEGHGQNEHEEGKEYKENVDAGKVELESEDYDDEVKLMENDRDNEELEVNKEQYREAEAQGTHAAGSEVPMERELPEETNEYSEIQGTNYQEGNDNVENEEQETPDYEDDSERGVLREEVPGERFIYTEEDHIELHNQESIEEEPEQLPEDDLIPHYDRSVEILHDNYPGNDVSEKEKANQKHIRFNENVDKSRSPTTPPEELLPSQGFLRGGSFRRRAAAQSSAILLTLTKAPVKRSGSDVSVTSLQDVELDVHTSARADDMATKSNLTRKAKSFGDLSSFRGTSVHMKDVDSDDEAMDDERRRVEEDQKELSVQKRIKKFEDRSKYGSNEKLNQIATSRVNYDGEEQGKRRWSNIFSAKNPKPSKKVGRTSTFRRDNLRSSKGSGKKTIESLVQNQSGAFLKHSSTLPNVNTTASRPRSWTKESPVVTRKFPSETATVTSKGDDGKVSTESPEEAPTVAPPEEVSDVLDLEVDSDLENFDREPETWCETVEKKTLSKMGKKEIKRQDIILELIKTEHHHLRTLKIMQQVFYRGLNKFANYSWEKLDQLFPRINELVDLSARFHRNLRCRQDEEAVVSHIGDIIVKYFSDENGEAIKQAYGEFVSKHQEGLALYKHYFKTDKKFANFIKKCHGHRIVRRLSIPECFTLVTQRLTKYPPLIEAVMKATKTSSQDHKQLQRSLVLVKEALQAVDNAIKDYEKQTKLKDIKARMEKGSVVLKGGVKIKNSRFSDYPSRMISDGVLGWRNARGKLTETHVVLLENMVVFLQENDKKFSLLSVDGKAPCVALKTLMVREVATDKNAIYFVSTSANERRGPEMYEFVCSNHKEKKQWIATISDAISKAPDEIRDLFQSPEEERKLAEERLHRRNEILEIMKNKDQELSRWVEDKNNLCAELMELLNMSNGNGKAKEDEVLTSSKVRDILVTAIRCTTQLTADSVQHLHESHSDSELAAVASDEKATAPKRAETFGGFDRRGSTKGSRRQTSTISEGAPEENLMSQSRDSGFSTTSLASESVSSALSTPSPGQEWGPGSFLQILEALQWVLNQFNQKETALENLSAQLQSAVDEAQELRLEKQHDEKKQLLIGEEHQAELARQKKAHAELERTLNIKTEQLRLQHEEHRDLLRGYADLQQQVRRR